MMMLFLMLLATADHVMKVPFRISSEYFDEYDYSKGKSLQNDRSLKSQIQTFEFVEAKKHADIFILKMKLSGRISLYSLDKKQFVGGYYEQNDGHLIRGLEPFFADKNLDDYLFVVGFGRWEEGGKECVMIVARHKSDDSFDVFFPHTEIHGMLLDLDDMIDTLFDENFNQSEFAFWLYWDGARITNLFRKDDKMFITIREMNYKIVNNRISFGVKSTVEKQILSTDVWHTNYDPRLLVHLQELKMFIRNAEIDTVNNNLPKKVEYFLHFAPVVQVLLEDGQSPDIKVYDETQKSYDFLVTFVLKMTSMAAEERIEMLKVLFESGADMNIRDSDGRNALFTVLDQRYFSSCNWITPQKNKQLDVFCSLLRFGACIWEEDGNGTNIFEYAKQSENYQIRHGLGTDLHLTLRQMQPLVKFVKNIKKENRVCETMNELKSGWGLLLHLPSQISIWFKVFRSLRRIEAMAKNFEKVINSIPDNDIKMYAIQNIVEKSMKRKRNE